MLWFGTIDTACASTNAGFDTLCTVLRINQDTVLLILSVLAVFRLLIPLAPPILAVFQDLILRVSAVLAAFQGFDAARYCGYRYFSEHFARMLLYGSQRQRHFFELGWPTPLPGDSLE